MLPTRSPWTVPLALALLMASPGGLRADEVHLKDGRRLEGKVLEDKPSGVTLRLRFGGDLTFPRAQVEKVVLKALPEEELEVRRKALAADDAAGRWALAEEAKGLGLRKVFEDLRAEVLRIDPDHAAARESRGDVLHDGRWMTPAERDRAVAEAAREAKESRGLVEYKGRWVTPEERDALERGLVQHEGRWMSEREAKALQGLVEFKGKWVKREELLAHALLGVLQEAAGVPMTVSLSEHFCVAAIYGQEATDRIAADAEKAYAEFAGWFAVPPGARLFDYVYARGSRERLPKRLGGFLADDAEGVADRENPFLQGAEGRRCFIVVLEKDQQYQRFIDGFLRFHPEAKYVLPDHRVSLLRKQKGFYLVDPDCWIVGYQFPFPPEQMRHAAVHKASHVLLNRWKFNGRFPPWWLVEGLAEVQEVNAFGRCDSFCITSGYGEKGGGEKWIEDSWKVTAKRMVAGGGDSRLEAILPRGLNDLTPLDLVKCWSFVHYLLSLDVEKFRRLAELVKGGTRSDEALSLVYDATVQELDKRWRDFVSRSY